MPGPAMPGPGLPGLGLPGAAPDGMTTGMIRRAELRKQLKIQQQLKGVTLVLVVLLLLLAYPVYLFAQTFAKDPVLAELDGLNLPEWAAYGHTDVVDGSRWCIQECRVRERTWYSERTPDETHPVYATALIDDGWRLRGGCQQAADDSIFSCWKKDEYVMIMHVMAPICAPTREPLPGTTESPDPATGSRECPHAEVTVLIMNAIDEEPPA
jgi:integrin beta 3